MNKLFDRESVIFCWGYVIGTFLTLAATWMFLDKCAFLFGQGWKYTEYSCVNEQKGLIRLYK